MKLYVLVYEGEGGEVTFEMPTHFGRTVRAYKTEGIARNMAKKFGGHVVEFDVAEGKILDENSNV